MSKPRVLVVDDEENIRFALKRWFEANGFYVEVAEDGAAAMRKCMETEFDVMTLDLEMPRMNGRDTIAAMRQLRPELPIIVLTGYFDQAHETQLQGVAKILVKPLSLHVLEAEVRKAMRTE